MSTPPGRRADTSRKSSDYVQAINASTGLRSHLHFDLPDRWVLCALNPPRRRALQRAPGKAVNMHAVDHSEPCGLNAALTKALVEVQVEHLEHTLARTVAFQSGDVVVAVMHDVLTSAEKALASNGRDGEVAEMRHLFQDGMETEFRSAVERLTGRMVIAFMGANHLEPDLAAEIFVLDSPL
jgi:uncharacterized protein YbcI